ncbi:hypothetical protein V8C44DRAFT_130701 [Trichoderma aethiopicum]
MDRHDRPLIPPLGDGRGPFLTAPSPYVRLQAGSASLEREAAARRANEDENKPTPVSITMQRVLLTFHYYLHGYPYNHRRDIFPPRGLRRQRHLLKQGTQNNKGRPGLCFPPLPFPRRCSPQTFNLHTSYFHLLSFALWTKRRGERDQSLCSLTTSSSRCSRLSVISSPQSPRGVTWTLACVCTQALALNRKGTTTPPVINEANRTGRGTWVTMRQRMFLQDFPFSFFPPRNARSSPSEMLFLGAVNQRCSRHDVLNPESLPGIMAFYDKIHNSLSRPRSSGHSIKSRFSSPAYPRP